MKLLFDPSISGCSGDMILGSLLQTGISIRKIQEQLSRIIKTKIELEIKTSGKGHPPEKRLQIKAEKDKHFHDYQGLEKEMEGVLKRARLEAGLEKKVRKIFNFIRCGEREVHGEVFHLHELGSLDTLIDVFGVMLCLQELNNPEVYSFCPAVGNGVAPATLHIAKLGKVRLLQKESTHELTTPTGIAILSAIGTFVNGMRYVPEKIIYSFGNQKLSDPNFIRLVCFEEVEKDEVYMVETNVDDVDSETLGNFIETHSDEFLDISMIPTTTKKNRPGFLVKIASKDAEDVIQKLFSELGTLGVRVSKIERRIQARKIKVENLNILGRKERVQFKVSEYGEKPEYEDLKRISEGRRIPLRKARELVENAKRKKIKNPDKRL